MYDYNLDTETNQTLSWWDGTPDTLESPIEMARAAMRQAPNDLRVREGIWTLDLTERYLLSEALEEAALGQITDRTDSFSGPLLRSALDAVDWDALAVQFIADARKLDRHRTLMVA